MKCDVCRYGPATVKVEFTPPLPLDRLFGLLKSVRALCNDCLNGYHFEYGDDLKILAHYEGATNN